MNWRDLDQDRLQAAVNAFYEPCEGTTIDGVRAAIVAWESAAPAPDEFPKRGRRDGKEPCGECHIGADETCDICGAKHATPVSHQSFDEARLRVADEREACATIAASFSETALKCDRCGDVRNTYAPGGCTGEAQFRESEEFKSGALLNGVYDTIRYFEKHLCRPREMTQEEISTAIAEGIRARTTAEEVIPFDAAEALKLALTICMAGEPVSHGISGMPIEDGRCASIYFAKHERDQSIRLVPIAARSIVGDTPVLVQGDLRAAHDDLLRANGILASQLREQQERASREFRRAESVQALLDKTLNVLNRCHHVLFNMAQENEGAIFRRWPIHHEPLRSDARNLLPLINEVLGDD